MGSSGERVLVSLPALARATPNSGLPPHPFELPQQLVRPLGIQLTPLAFNHQHFDILYAATPFDDSTLLEPFRWFTPAEADDHGAPPDVIAFATVATSRVSAV